MRIALIQHDIVWEDATATISRVAPMIERAAAAGAELILLPEMFATGFSMALDRMAEPAGGRTEAFLRETAARLGVWLIGSISQYAEAAPGGVVSSADISPAAPRRGINVGVVAGPNREHERYVKIHPFSYAGEHETYDAGKDFVTVAVDELRVTVFVCYDLRFADEFWACAEGTDLFVVPANWPAARREHWRTLLRARAIENQCYVAGCNRVGATDRLEYLGDSAVIDPLGRTIVEGALVETVLLAEVDPGEVRRVRDRFPFLPDRR
jgi:predicted amidohydrolase